MSVYYYLVCDEHKEGVFITDNKGNPPEREHVVEFFMTHLHKGCAIGFRSEFEDDKFDEPDWDERVKQTNAEWGIITK